LRLGQALLRYVATCSLQKCILKCDEGVIEKLKLKFFLDLSVSEKWTCSCQAYCIPGLVFQLMSGKKVFQNDIDDVADSTQQLKTKF
jgi:hypothetical protein